MEPLTEIRSLINVIFGKEDEIFFYSPRCALTGHNAGLPIEDGVFIIPSDRIHHIECDKETGCLLWYEWTDSNGDPRKSIATRFQLIKREDATDLLLRLMVRACRDRSEDQRMYEYLKRDFDFESHEKQLAEKSNV